MKAKTILTIMFILLVIAGFSQKLPTVKMETRFGKIVCEIDTVHAPVTASTEFFICIGDQPSLDFGGKRNPDGQGFAVFGRVVSGMEVVRKIQQQKDTSQYLVEPVKIEVKTL